MLVCTYERISAKIETESTMFESAAEQCGYVRVENGVAEICDHPVEIPGRFCVCCEWKAGLVDHHRFFRFMGVPEEVIEGPHLHIADEYGRIVGVARFQFQEDEN
jgi:hypothetical protein